MIYLDLVLKHDYKLQVLPSLQESLQIELNLMNFFRLNFQIIIIIINQNINELTYF